MSYLNEWVFDLQLFSGVDEGSDAGDQEEEADEDDEITVDYFLEKDDEEDEEAVGEEEEEETEEEEEEKLDPKTEEAFAKRLAAEREKMKKEFQQEFDNRLNQIQQQPPPGQPAKSDKEIKKELEELADDLGLSTEAVEILYRQQLALNQQNQRLQEAQGVIESMKEDVSKGDAKAEIESMRSKNPHLPAFDENRLREIRKTHRDTYGVSLPWKEAYKQLVAEEAMAGKLARQVQQETIGNITKRGKATTKAGKKGKASKKPDLWDLPPEQFEELQQKALRGELKTNQ